MNFLSQGTENASSLLSTGGEIAASRREEEDDEETAKNDQHCMHRTGGVLRPCCFKVWVNGGGHCMDGGRGERAAVVDGHHLHLLPSTDIWVCQPLPFRGLSRIPPHLLRQPHPRRPRFLVCSVLVAVKSTCTCSASEAPGEGPSKEERDTGFFWIDYHASGKTNEGKEVVCRGKVGSDKGDCGYKETGKVQISIQYDFLPLNQSLGVR